MLRNFKSVYNATVIERMHKDDALFLARLNMDEFAMGSHQLHLFVERPEIPIILTLLQAVRRAVVQPQWPHNLFKLALARIPVGLYVNQQLIVVLLD